MDGTLGETLTAGSFAGDGATLYLDAGMAQRTRATTMSTSREAIRTTALHLESTSITWEGALGTGPCERRNEQGLCERRRRKRLHYYDLKLTVRQIT